MSHEFDCAVYIGRFQPFHNSHLDVLEHALSIAEKVIVAIGSSHASSNIKNPWTFSERKQMISDSLHPQERRRVDFIPIRDYFYNENQWVTELQTKVKQVTKYSNSIALVGSYKDASSYYLNSFPEWEFVPVKTCLQDLNATDIRKIYFEDNSNSIEEIGKVVPHGVVEFLNTYKNHPSWTDMSITEPRYVALKKEYDNIKKYKEQWSDAPYPPTFVTADAVVIQSGHVLVVKRKYFPGKDLYALPGGFVRVGEEIKRAALRELKEETGIRVDAPILESSIIDSKVFDYPDRSLRGRTITHAYCIKLKHKQSLPDLKAGDDASYAQWMSISDIMMKEDEFFEDHVHIIRYFVNKF